MRYSPEVWKGGDVNIWLGIEYDIDGTGHVKRRWLVWVFFMLFKSIQAKTCLEFVFGVGQYLIQQI